MSDQPIKPLPLAGDDDSPAPARPDPRQGSGPNASQGSGANASQGSGATDSLRIDGPAGKDEFVLCPYCGHVQKHESRCDECGGLFEPLSRRATQISMGPWYIRDKKNPFKPGFSYDVLVRMIRAGKVKSHTVLRGPTTRQFWSVARNVLGVSHLLGHCHRCGAKVMEGSAKCGQCGEGFGPVKGRNELGLMFPSDADAEAAQRALQREKELMFAGGKPGDSGAFSSLGGTATPPPGAKPAIPPAGGAPKGDLLSQVLGPIGGAGPAVPSATPKKRSSSSGASGAYPAQSGPDAAKATGGPLAKSNAMRQPHAVADRARGLDALDFGPSDETDGRDDVKGLESKNRLFTVALVAMGLISVVLLVIVLVLVLGSGNKPAGTPAKPGDGTATPAPGPAASLVGHWVIETPNGGEGDHLYFTPTLFTQIAGPSPAAGQPARATQQYAVLANDSESVRIQLPQRSNEIWLFRLSEGGKKARINRETASGENIGGTLEVKYLDDREGPGGAPGASAGNKDTGTAIKPAPPRDPSLPAAAVADPAAGGPAERWDRQFASASGTEQEGKYQAALDEFNKLLATAPDTMRKHRATARTERVKGKIEREPAVRFFGLPAD